jgi:hypothetical protein
MFHEYLLLIDITEMFPVAATNKSGLVQHDSLLEISFVLRTLARRIESTLMQLCPMHAKNIFILMTSTFYCHPKSHPMIFNTTDCFHSQRCKRDI